MTSTVENIADVRRLFDDAEEFETLPPIHPGEILREEFMASHSLTAGMVAKAIDVPRSRIERIVKEEIGISTDTALRLGRLFRTSAELWTNLQTRFERETLLAEIGPNLDGIEPLPEQAQAA